MGNGLSRKTSSLSRVGILPPYPNSQNLYYCIYDVLCRAFPDDFGQKVHATGRKGHSAYKKVPVALRWLTTKLSFGDIDDSSRIVDDSVRSFFFCFATVL